MDLIISLVIWGFFICLAIWLFQIFIGLVFMLFGAVIFIVAAPFVWIYNKLKEVTNE